VASSRPGWPSRQVDATTLRAKYGAPLKYGTPVNSETFKVRNNIEIVVNYGPSGQVCRIELPSGQSIVGQAPPDGATKLQLEEALKEVVPLSMRRKEIRWMQVQMGALSLLRIEYEHVTITKIPPSFTVAFKEDGCETPEMIR
jgi:hypothetical protein